MSNFYYTIIFNKQEIADDITEQLVIEAAERYFLNELEESGYEGEYEEDCTLVQICDETGAEVSKPVTITVEMFRDSYDGGAFDYYSSRGV